MCLGERFKKGPRDDAQGRFVELVKREPLAKQAAGGEALTDGIEVFPRVEEAGAVLRGMEKIGDDHVIVFAARANESPGIGGDEADDRQGVWSSGFSRSGSRSVVGRVAG